MFSSNTRTWLLDTLDQSTIMDEFLCDMGADTTNSDAVIDLVQRGLSGDSKLRIAAINYLADVDLNKRAWRVDHALMQHVGLAPLFSMALLHSFGPYSHTGDFSDDNADDIRGLLQIDQPPRSQHKGRTALSLIVENGAWELQVNIALTPDIYWRSDFRGDTNHDGPDILIEEAQLPEAFINGRPNRPLREVISHHVLDPFPLAVSAINENSPDYILDIAGAREAMDFNALIDASR